MVVLGVVDMCHLLFKAEFSIIFNHLYVKNNLKNNIKKNLKNYVKKLQKNNVKNNVKITETFFFCSSSLKVVGF